MENQRDREFVLPKNIRQMGKLGETYKIYVEDFVYTYVHRTLREEQKNPDFVAAVLLGRHFSRAGQEYIFINGAQQVEFSLNYAIDSNMHFEKQMSDEIQNAALYFAEEVAQPDGVTDEVSRAVKLSQMPGRFVNMRNSLLQRFLRRNVSSCFGRAYIRASRNIFLSMNCWAGILNWMAVIRKYQHPCSSFLMPRRNTVPVSCICRTG